MVLKTIVGNDLMPNHFHGIIEITAVGATLVVAQNDAVAPNNAVVKLKTGQPQGIAPTDKTVGDMIGTFESISRMTF